MQTNWTRKLDFVWTETNRCMPEDIPKKDFIIICERSMRENSIINLLLLFINFKHFETLLLKIIPKKKPAKYVLIIWDYL